MERTRDAIEDDVRSRVEQDEMASEEPTTDVVGEAGAQSGCSATFKAAAGWVVREGARRGDYEVVPQQP